MDYELKNGLFLPPGSGKYNLPKSLPANTRRAIGRILEDIYKSESTCRTVDLSHLARLMDERPEDVFGNDFFPMPDGYGPGDWAELKSRLMVLVNLLKASVRKLRHRVYGGYQHRRVIRNPYQAEIEEFISGWYGADMRDWFTNRLAYSNAPCVVLGKRVGQKQRVKLCRWIPDPCFVYLAPSEENHRDYSGIAEVSPGGGRIQFVTPEAEGILYAGREPVVIAKSDENPADGQGFVRITDMGFLPGVVAHGESRRNRRSPYSEPPFKSAIKFTIRATDILFNGGLLQKVQTKGLLAVSGVQDRITEDFAEMMRQGIVYLDENGKIQFVTPQSNITDTLALLDRLIEVFSVCLTIPVDDLNPTSAKGTSAEEAQRRAEGFQSQSRELTEASTLDEEELVVRATGVRKWMDPGAGEVDLEELRGEVETEINLQPPLKPLMSQADAQISQMGADLGALLPEDLARVWQPYSHSAKLDAVAQNIKATAEAKAQAAAMKGTNKQGGGPGENEGKDNA